MKRLRLWSVFLTAALTCAAGFAADPKAGIKGPSTANVGDSILIQLTGCVADSPDQIWLKSQGPEVLTPQILFDSSGNIAAAVVTMSVPGDHQFVVITQGMPATAKKADVAVASLTVTVSPPAPPTPPAPQPTPTPTPTPAPTPAPIPATTLLYVAAVYSGNTADADELTFTRTRDDQAMVATLRSAALNIDWREYMDAPATNGQPSPIDVLKLRPYVAKLGKTPCLVVYDGKGVVYDANGLPSQSAIPAPLTSAGMISLIKKLRGVQ